MKIVCYTSRVPWPLEKGDKLRVYHQLKQLSAKHEIILCAVSDIPIPPDAVTELKKFCAQIHLVRITKPAIFFQLLKGFFSGLPMQVAYFTSAKAKRQFDEVIRREKPDRIYCQLIRTAEYMKGHASIPAVIDYMDIFSKGVERRIEKVAAWKRPVFRMEWKRLLDYEEKVFGWFKGHSIISEQDRELLPVADRKKVQVIPNGVDTDFFHPEPHAKDFDLLFNGNMNYPPNIESALYIAHRILPIVRRTKPKVKLLISGANPSAEILALRSEHVEVTGWIEDVRESFARSQILVAPMQSSIGLQNKILEAMAMKLPCITTTLSNNAVKAIPDRQILVADTPEQFATFIHLLLDHPEKAGQLAENGFRLVHEKFNWEKTCNLLDDLLQNAGRA